MRRGASLIEQSPKKVVFDYVRLLRFGRDV
jgi:hypothetical protein